MDCARVPSHHDRAVVCPSAREDDSQPAPPLRSAASADFLPGTKIKGLHTTWFPPLNENARTRIERMQWMEKQALGYVIRFIRAIRGPSTECPFEFSDDRQHSESFAPTVRDALRPLRLLPATDPRLISPRSHPPLAQWPKNLPDSVHPPGALREHSRA